MFLAILLVNHFFKKEKNVFSSSFSQSSTPWLTACEQRLRPGKGQDVVSRQQGLGWGAAGKDTEEMGRAPPPGPSCSNGLKEVRLAPTRRRKTKVTSTVDSSNLTAGCS